MRSCGEHLRSMIFDLLDRRWDWILIRFLRTRGVGRHVEFRRACQSNRKLLEVALFFRIANDGMGARQSH